ncbi:MAG: hypothetical protein RSB71_01750 [Bacilli bacterium]
MENLFFDSVKDLNHLLANLYELGGGSEATCYKFKNMVLKYFNGPCCEQRDKEQIMQFTNLNNDSFLFPKAIIYIKEEIVGCLMPFVEGKNNNEFVFKRANYQQIIDATTKIYNDTLLLSDKKIIGIDICDVNTIFDGNKFSIIDTLDFYVDLNKDNIFKGNISAFSNGLFEHLVVSVKDFVNDKESLKRYKKDKYLMENPIYFLELLRNELSQYCGFEITRLEEAAKILKKK